MSRPDAAPPAERREALEVAGERADRDAVRALLAAGAWVDHAGRRWGSRWRRPARRAAARARPRDDRAAPRRRRVDRGARRRGPHAARDRGARRARGRGGAASRARRGRRRARRQRSAARRVHPWRATRASGPRVALARPPARVLGGGPARTRRRRSRRCSRSASIPTSATTTAIPRSTSPFRPARSRPSTRCSPAVRAPTSSTSPATRRWRARCTTALIADRLLRAGAVEPQPRDLASPFEAAADAVVCRRSRRARHAARSRARSRSRTLRARAPLHAPALRGGERRRGRSAAHPAQRARGGGALARARCRPANAFALLYGGGPGHTTLALAVTRKGVPSRRARA